MKKFLCMLAVLTAAVPALQAERIRAVYFNPSRLGSYDILRVSERLATNGGLQTASVNINANPSGVVSALATDKLTGDSTYSYRFGPITTNSAVYATESMGIDAGKGIINMPGTAFEITNVVATGGTASFTGTGGVYSSLNNIASDSTVNLRGNTLNASTPPTVKVSGASSVTLEGETTAIKGLRLGGNLIPLPLPNNCNYLKWNTLGTHQALSCEITAI